MTSIDYGADSEGIVSDSGQGRSMSASTLTRSASGLLTTPGLPYVVACVLAAAAAVVDPGNSGPVVWGAVAVVSGAMGADFALARPQERVGTFRPVKRLVLIAGTGALVAAAFAWLNPTEIRSLGVIVLLAVAGYAIAAVVAQKLQAPRSVLLVGGRVGIGQLVAEWESCPEVDVLGICLPEFLDESAQVVGRVPILGSLDEVATIAASIRVDQVVVVPGPLLSEYHVRRLSWALENTPIELSVAAAFDGVVPRRITPRVLGRRVTLTVRPGRRTGVARWVKAIVDRIAAAILLAILSPIFALVAMIIRLDSPGPAIFRQTRVGLDGSTFTIYKFRTMMVGAEAKLAELLASNEAAGPLFKMAADPRTTGVGRLLRSTSLDELPQLINVLKGEMSLIGPRPCLPGEALTYDDWIHRRLRVKPGMTGAWQVGGRSNLSWSDSVRLDIDYVDNATLLDDMLIAIKTARVVVSREGAV